MNLHELRDLSHIHPSKMTEIQKMDATYALQPLVQYIDALELLRQAHHIWEEKQQISNHAWSKFVHKQCPETFELYESTLQDAWIEKDRFYEAKSRVIMLQKQWEQGHDK